MPLLYGLRTSPWTAKVRWALDHHRVAYRYREHVPLLGELSLRWRAGSLRRKATVPLFVDGDLLLTDSLSIARHADAVGAGPPLLPQPRAEAILELDAEGDAILSAARGRVLARVGANADARREALPPGMPRVLGPTTALATRFMARKYQSDADSDDRMARAVRPRLEALRARLSGRRYLADEFSYADVSVASVLHCLRPPREPWCTFGAGMREAWTHDGLAREFEDLLAWRDGIFEAHYQPA